MVYIKYQLYYSVNGLLIDEKNILATYNDPNWWNAKRCIKICKNRKWIPLSKNSKLIPKLAYMVGKVMGDGHLDNSFVARFSSGRRETLEKLKMMINEDFRIPLDKMNILEVISWGRSFCLIVYDCMFGRFLESLGAPRGRKTEINLSIPVWIHSSINTKRTFLQGILEDELANFRIRRGCVTVAILKMTKNIKLRKNLIEFLNEIKYLLDEFNVNCSEVMEACPNRFGKFEAYFWIRGGSKNVISFSENVGFKLDIDKIESLNRAVDSAKDIISRKNNQ